MENEIRNAASVTAINAILHNWAGQYDLDIVMLAKEGISVSAKKGIVDTHLERGTVSEYTGRDVYSVESSKELNLVKDLVIKSIKYRTLILTEIS